MRCDGGGGHGGGGVGACTLSLPRRARAVLTRRRVRVVYVPQWPVCLEGAVYFDRLWGGVTVCLRLRLFYQKSIYLSIYYFYPLAAHSLGTGVR